MRHPAHSLRSLRRTPLLRTFFPVFLLILLSLSLAPASLAQEDAPLAAPPDIARMQVLVEACGDMEVNTLCYGGGAVNIMTNGTTTTLNEVGARLPLAGVEQITTSADDASCTWGGVVLRLQGAAGTSLAGLTYVALGNVVLQNTTAPETLFTPAAAQQVTVNTENLNFRSAPSMNAGVVGQFDTGDLLDADALSADGTWLHVAADGATGWVAREFTQSAADLTTLPTLSNSSKGWMQDFTVQTTPSACPAALPSLLVVQSMGSTRVPLNVNGTDISIGSTIAFNTISNFALGGPDTVNGLGGPDTVDPSETELGGPDTIDPSETELGGPDTVDPSENQSGVPDPFNPADALLDDPEPAGMTQMVVIDGSLVLPMMEVGDDGYAFDDGTGAIAGYGFALNPHDNGQDFVVSEGTSILVPQVQGPIIGAVLQNVAAVVVLIGQMQAKALEDQAAVKDELEAQGFNLAQLDAVNNGMNAVEAAATLIAQQQPDDFDDNVENGGVDVGGLDRLLGGDDDDGSDTTLEIVPVSTPGFEQSSGLTVIQMMLRQQGQTGDEPTTTFDTVPLPEGVVFAEDLGVVQAIGGFLPEEEPKPHLDLPDYFGDWLGAEIQEPSGAHCDDFEVISPKSGFLLLPPDSDLTFIYPNVATANWAMYTEMGDIARLGMVTTFHLGRPSGNDLKAPITQEFSFPVDNAHLGLASLTEPKSITYNYYQLQGMGLIIPNATSGQLVWWVENTLYYIGFDEDTGLPIGVPVTCVTGINIINWANEYATTEVSNEPIDQSIVPIDDSVGDTIPDLDIDLLTPTPFIPPTAQNLPIEAATPTPAPRDSDGDGVPDDADRCPAERGVPENAGCPLPPPSDRDGDTVPDDRDRCPDQRGTVENNGCPVRAGG